MSLILAVDDEHHILEVLDAILGDEGHTVLRAADGLEAMALLTDAVDLIITDLVMPNQEGLETIAQVRRCGVWVPVIAMTAGGPGGLNRNLQAARFAGADAVLPKPFSRTDVLTPVRALLAQSSSCDGSADTISA